MNILEYMENNKENKARFFAQYWGQYVLRFPNNDDYLKIIDWFNFVNGYLELTSISKITDYDASNIAELSDIMIGNHKDDNYESLKDFKIAIINFYDLKNLPYTAADYLRKKGYAVPYDDLSVEQLIEYGWIKLKE